MSTNRPGKGLGQRACTLIASLPGGVRLLGCLGLRRVRVLDDIRLTHVSVGRAGIGWGGVVDAWHEEWRRPQERLP